MFTLVDAFHNKQKFKFKKTANFDGKNWFIKFPKDLTKFWDKKTLI